MCRRSTLESCGNACSYFRGNRCTLAVAGLVFPVVPLVAHRMHRFEIVSYVIVGILVDVVDMPDAVTDT